MRIEGFREMLRKEKSVFRNGEINSKFWFTGPEITYFVALGVLSSIEGNLRRNRHLIGDVYDEIERRRDKLEASVAKRSFFRRIYEVKEKARKESNG